MAPAPPTGPGKSTASWHADRADAIKTRLDSVGVGDNKAHNKPPEDALKGNGSARGGSGGGGGESASRKAPSADVAGDLLSGFSIYYYIFFYLLLERPLALMLLGICSLGFCSCLYSTLSFPVCFRGVALFSLCGVGVFCGFPPCPLFFSLFFFSAVLVFFVGFPLVLCVSLVFPKP